MNKVECVLDMSGLQKKNYVLNETKKLLGNEVRGPPGMKDTVTSLLHLLISSLMFLKVKLILN